MKSKHSDRIPEYLHHILDAINRALGYEQMVALLDLIERGA